MKKLNKVTSDASVSYDEDGSVSINIAPWHYSHEITDRPKTIRGRMLFRGEYNEGDGGRFVPCVQSGKKLYTSLFKTPHGELRTTAQKVVVNFAFGKTDDKAACMKALYLEVMQMKRFVKANLQHARSLAQSKEDMEWEKMK